MLDRETFEELNEEIDKLKTKNIIIIVEGYKDKKSLQSLGFERIIPLARRALFKVVEEVVAKEEKRVAILTDLDKTGKKLYSRLKSDLSERGVTIDDRFRNFLFRKTSLRQIEGLSNYIYRNQHIKK